MKKIFKSKMVCGSGYINRFRIRSGDKNSIEHTISRDGIVWEEESRILYPIIHPVDIDVLNIEDLGTNHEFLVVVLSKYKSVSIITLALYIGVGTWLSIELLNSIELGVNKVKKLRIVRNAGFINIYISTIKDCKKAVYVVQIKDYELKESLENENYEEYLKVNYEIRLLE